MDGIISEKGVVAAVQMQIAASVVANLTDEVKEKIIGKAVTSLIDDYQFKHVIEKQLLKQAIHEFEEYMTRSDVRDRVRTAAVAAAEQFIGKLSEAILMTLCKSCGVGYDKYSDPDFIVIMRRVLGLPEKTSQ
jgi:hypothetical protein